MHPHMPLIASGKVKFTYVRKESRRQTLVPSSTFEPRNSKIDPSCENPSAPHELRSRVIMGKEGDHGRHSPTGRMPRSHIIGLPARACSRGEFPHSLDRKSTRLNSSH